MTLVIYFWLIWPFASSSLLELGILVPFLFFCRDTIFEYLRLLQSYSSTVIYRNTSFKLLRIKSRMAFLLVDHVTSWAKNRNYLNRLSLNNSVLWTLPNPLQTAAVSPCTYLTLAAFNLRVLCSCCHPLCESPEAQPRSSGGFVMLNFTHRTGKYFVRVCQAVSHACHQQRGTGMHRVLLVLPVL